MKWQAPIEITCQDYSTTSWWEVALILVVIHANYFLSPVSADWRMCCGPCDRNRPKN